MTEWSNDPVFGDLALKLEAREIWGPRPVGSTSPEEEAHLTLRFDVLDPESRFGLPPVFVHSEEPGARCSVMVELQKLATGAVRLPLLGCLLATARNAASHPAVPRMMGVVNVTPDSLSDRGSHFDAQRAIEHGLALVREGADMLDVGGESTRPGSESVSAAEELRRVIPVVRGLAERAKAPISIDTTKSVVAAEALAAGASIVNDVSAGRADPKMLWTVARARAGFIAMHMLGTPRDMQHDPRYTNVIRDVTEFLRARCRVALEAGIHRSRLWVDPGIGFGKTLEHNRALLLKLSELRSLGLPIVLGVSRKSFIAAIEEQAGCERSEPDDRLGGTLAAVALGVQSGAEILRVHDVRAAKQAALVARALAPWSGAQLDA